MCASATRNSFKVNGCFCLLSSRLVVYRSLVGRASVQVRVWECEYHNLRMRRGQGHTSRHDIFETHTLSHLKHFPCVLSGVSSKWSHYTRKKIEANERESVQVQWPYYHWWTSFAFTFFEHLIHSLSLFSFFRSTFEHETKDCVLFYLHWVRFLSHSLAANQSWMCLRSWETRSSGRHFSRVCEWVYLSIYRCVWLCQSDCKTSATQFPTVDAKRQYPCACVL